MANRRLLVKRRKAVRNIRKITRTMQLIATARFQAANARVIAAQPYTEKLAEMVADLSGATENIDHPLMARNEGVDTATSVVISASRGFCGSYNINVLKSAVAHLDDQISQGATPDVRMVGTKGINFFRFLRRAMTDEITHISDAPRFDQVEPIANDLIDRFSRGEIASAHVVYMKFLSSAKQQPTVVQLLPIASDSEESDGGSSQEGASRGGRNVAYEFSPDPIELLDELLPATVRVRLFQCFIDAAASEQISRMVAMKAATDAAGDMISLLTRQYNRARQTAITMELLDIVGGANAIA